MNCFFVSDLHGSITRYTRLFEAIHDETPDAVFIGGDILPSGLKAFFNRSGNHESFILDFIKPGLLKLRSMLNRDYPEVFMIPGNDDGRFEEAAMEDLENEGLWTCVHHRRVPFDDYTVYGYAFVPPTPFMLKDWERYDVSRYVDPGCVPPTRGMRSVPAADEDIEFSTIKEDLRVLAGNDSLDRSIFLFHSPPYQTHLDRAALDGRMIDHVPLDVHVGSIAIKKFIETRQPMVTLHGHIHESARITGHWLQQIGRTFAFTAAHDGPELALVTFNPESPETATRRLL
ncbi:MAG TPA: metallophosphoesterase [bacterium]|nr:metallophosphoesterase [bacterium]